MMKFVDENDLETSFPYLDNVTICGKDQEDHGVNMNIFSKLPNARTSVITLKSVSSQPCVSLCSDTSSRRVPYDRILIVYDPCVHSPFHMTQSP